MTIGRNEPCPCGSGKTYKRCCLRRERGSGSPGESIAVAEEMPEISGRSEVSAKKEAQAQPDRLVQKKNENPIAEFHGLTLAQMESVLRAPFDSPEVARFSENLPADLSAPFIDLLALLVDAINTRDLKPTSTGNFPPEFCREVARRYWGEEKYAQATANSSLRSERNFYDLHCLRLLAELAGVVRKYRGTFIIGTKFRSVLATQGAAALYPLLFKTYATSFNWGYGDGFEDMLFIQRSFLFSLFLLNTFGDIERPHTFYQDQFVKAFPTLLNEVTGTASFPPEMKIRSMYFGRTFLRCFNFFGLAELKPEKGEGVTLYTVKKFPLLDDVVKFYV